MAKLESDDFFYRQSAKLFESFNQLHDIMVVGKGQALSPTNYISVTKLHSTLQKSVPSARIFNSFYEAGDALEDAVNHSQNPTFE